jgi:hypothetical protein
VTRTCYHLVHASHAHRHGDVLQAALHSTSASDIWTMDNAMRQLAPAAVASPLVACFSCILIMAVQVAVAYFMHEAIIAKNRCGGWWPWLVRVASWLAALAGACTQRPNRPLGWQCCCTLAKPRRREISADDAEVPLSACRSPSLLARGR